MVLITLSRNPSSAPTINSNLSLALPIFMLIFPPPQVPQATPRTPPYALEHFPSRQQRRKNDDDTGFAAHNHAEIVANSEMAKSLVEIEVLNLVCGDEACLRGGEVGCSGRGGLDAEATDDEEGFGSMQRMNEKTKGEEGER